MSNGIRLTYALTTRNKLAFLKGVLAQLVTSMEADEEIVVADGGSTDGTVEFLQSQYRAGWIHQLVSAPDRGEAHGMNRAFLLARGELIKVVTDDDSYHWPGIRECKDFMLKHPEIDALGTEGAGTTWESEDPFDPSSSHVDFREWLLQHTPFSFCGLGLMIRRDSLALVGLFNTAFVRVDHEFTLRLTSGPANLAWYTGRTWVRMVNPQSNAVTQAARLAQETERVNRFYSSGRGHIPAGGRIMPVATGLARWRRLLAKVARALGVTRLGVDRPQSHAAMSWESKAQLSAMWLRTQPAIQAGVFLYRK